MTENIRSLNMGKHSFIDDCPKDILQFPKASRPKQIGNKSTSSPSKSLQSTLSVVEASINGVRSDSSGLSHSTVSITDLLHADTPRAKFWYDVKNVLLSKTDPANFVLPESLSSPVKKKKSGKLSLSKSNATSNALNSNNIEKIKLELILEKYRLAHEMCRGDTSPMDPLLHDEPWIDIIDLSYKDFYRNLYEDMENLELDEKTKLKVGKDVKRTFGLFIGNDATTSAPTSAIPDTFGAFSDTIFDDTSMSLFEESLRVILSIMSYERGYCQGTNFIAGLMLLKEKGNDRNAFFLVSYLLRQCHLEMLYYSKHMWSAKRSLSNVSAAAAGAELKEPIVAIRCQTLSSLSHEHWQPAETDGSKSIAYKSKMSMSLENGNGTVIQPSNSSSSSFLYDYITHFEMMFKLNNEKLYRHLQDVGFPAVCYAVEWFTTCFIKACPGDLCTCVLDLIFLGVDDALIRTGLAILDFLEEKLLKMDCIELQVNFKAFVKDIKPIEVIPQALLINLPKDSSGIDNGVGVAAGGADQSRDHKSHSGCFIL